MPFQSMVSPSFHSHPKIKMLDGGAWLDSFYDHAKHTDFFPENVAYLRSFVSTMKRMKGKLKGLLAKKMKWWGNILGKSKQYEKD